MATEPIGVAVVGAGYWGPNLVRNIQSCRALRLEYLCDLDVGRAGTVLGPYSTVKATSSLDEVLEDPRVHAVAVATPAATHSMVALRVLESGRHVLVEKPLASSVAEGRALVETARARDLVLMCDHTYCYTPAVRRIRELVRSGYLGDIHYVDSVRINLGLVQRDVDVLWDLAPHDLSILDVILPDGVVPEAVAAHGADPIGAGRVCVAYLALTLSSGAIAHSHVNWLSPTKVRTTIVGGSARTLIWDDLNPSQRLSVYDRGVDLADPATLATEARQDIMISYRTGDMVAPALREREALAEVMTEWAAAINDRRAPLTDGEAGLRILTVLEAASRSLEEHGAVQALNRPLAVAR